MNKEANIKAFLDKFQLESIDELNNVLGTGRLRVTIEKRYGLTDDGKIWTLQDIADLFNFSRQRIHQLLEHARRDLKGYTKRKKSINELVAGLDKTKIKYLKDLRPGELFKFVISFEDGCSPLFGCVSLDDEDGSPTTIKYINLETKANHNHYCGGHKTFNSLSSGAKNLVEIVDRAAVDGVFLDRLDQKLEFKAKRKEEEAKNVLPLRCSLDVPKSIEAMELAVLFEKQKNRHLLIKLNRAGLIRISDLLDNSLFAMRRKGFSRQEVMKLVKRIVTLSLNSSQNMKESAV